MTEKEILVTHCKICMDEMACSLSLVCESCRNELRIHAEIQRWNNSLPMGAD